MQTLTIDNLRPRLISRPPAGHKGTFGHALIVAGQYGMAGAALMCARACFKSGVGKVTLHIPQRLNDIVQMGVPEAIVHHDTDSHCFTTPEDAGAYDAVAIGPGLGTAPPTINAVGRQLELAHAKKCVVDADALNALALQPALFGLLPDGAVVTPHPGEYRRMAADEQPADFARHHGVVLVLKGHPTRIYTPDGDVYECPWGNSGMGTAGSGDVLTGIVAALMAQGHAPLDAALLGVSLHALAGDTAAARLGEYSLVASDIIHHLPEAFRQLMAK